MGNTARIILSCLITVALAVPAFAGSSPGLGGACSNVAGTVYRGGVSCLQGTEGFVTGCLKNTFSLFNPCLDVFKVAANVAFYPLDKSVGYVENCLCGPAPAKKATQAAAPSKQKTPK